MKPDREGRESAEWGTKGVYELWAVRVPGLSTPCTRDSRSALHWASPHLQNVEPKQTTQKQTEKHLDNDDGPDQNRQYVESTLCNRRSIADLTNSVSTLIQHSKIIVVASSASA